jgi:hypothetical protein
LQPSRLRLQLSVFQLAAPQVRTLSLLGADFTFADDADVSPCCRLVFASLPAAEIDLCCLNSLDENSRLWEYCTEAGDKPQGLHFTRPTRFDDRAFHLEVAGSFEAYLATLGSSTRGSLKRRVKKLTTEHSATLIKVTQADQVRSFLEGAHTVSIDSWQAKTYGTLIRPTEAEITRLEHIARQGWLRCYLLAGAAGPLAYQFGYHYGDTYYACDFAFARKWSALGPGASLMYLMLEDLYRHDSPQVIDLGPGDSPQKHTFRGSPRIVRDYYVVPHARWRYLIYVQRRLAEVERAARSVLAHVGLDNAVRRVLKHKH